MNWQQICAALSVSESISTLARPTFPRQMLWIVMSLLSLVAGKTSDYRALSRQDKRIDDTIIRTAASCYLLADDVRSGGEGAGSA